MNIERVNENIYRTTIAYKDIFTTIYVIKTPNGAVLFDAASFDEDVDHSILPFLREVGVTRQDLKYVFISHNHKDHAGGLPALLPKFPDVCVVSGSDSLAAEHEGYTFKKPEDNDILLDVLQVITIPGHTADSMALLDKRTGTLITGDCLQLYGIYGSGAWGSNIGFPVELIQAVEKVRGLPVEEILTAHDYHPCGYHYCGTQQVARALDACLAPIWKVKELLKTNPNLDDAGICKQYNDAQYLPTLNARLVSAVRQAMAEGQIQ